MKVTTSNCIFDGAWKKIEEEVDRVQEIVAYNHQAGLLEAAECGAFLEVVNGF